MFSALNSPIDLLKKSSFASVVILALFIIYGCYVQISIPQQAILGWLIVIVLWIVKKAMGKFSRLQRIFLIILSVFLAGRYWFFRTFDTLSYPGFFDFTAMTLLYLAETYAIAIHILGMFTNVFTLQRKLSPIDLTRADLPSVDIFIPTYNEPVHIVEITATACTQLHYPKDRVNIYILDDGGTKQKLEQKDAKAAGEARQRRIELETLARSLEIRYMTREANLHAKAGNINHALLQTEKDGSGGDLVAILDCDHVPAQDFLENTVGHFLKDEKLFLVQTPHFFLNPDPVEKNLDTFQENPGENEMFYGAVHLGLDFWNASFFCGSAALLRRSLLVQHGGIAGETVTEDAETALKLHGLGYNSLYVAKPMICGLSPETLESFILQRSRWTQGMVQIFILKNPLFNRRLSLPQKICYLNSSLFWFFSLARCIFYLSPLLFLFFGLRIYNASMSQIIFFSLPHLMGVVIVSDYLYGRVRHPFFSEMYETMQGFSLLPALIGTILRPRSPVFNVTPKGDNLRENFLSPIAWPFYVMLILSLASCPVAVTHWFQYPLDRATVLLCGFWMLFNLFLTFQCLGIVWEKKQIRGHHRAITDQEAVLEVTEAETEISGRIVDVSLSGFRFVSRNVTGLLPGAEIKIKAENSNGQKFSLPAVIVRSARKDSPNEIGCSFTSENKEIFRQTVAFLYGDSLRWEQFWNRRRENSFSVLYSYFYLFKKGIEGTYINFLGAVKPLAKGVGAKMKHRWEKKNVGFKG